jgi:hypothetical protein
MPGIEPFARKWHNVSWAPPTSGPIPRNGFKDRSTVLITIRSTPLGGIPACDIAWQNSAGEPCSMSLPLQDGSLKSGSVSVRFGGSAVDCQVAVTLEGGQIKGTLRPSLPSHMPIDGNTGTFAADANPPAGDGPAST